MINIKLLMQRLNSWSILSLAIMILITIPSFYIFLGVFEAPGENWQHIAEFLLKDYIYNSTILVVFTGLFSALIGLSLAWLIAAYDFPMRRFFKWSLILPLAIPPYIGGFTYVGLLNYTGPIQSFFRNYLNITLDPAVFDIMSPGGAIFIYTIFLYPYVYLITRSYLSKQSASLLEVSRTLGRSPLKTFVQVIVPISRGAVVAGVSLVVLEVLNDYGVVKYFGIPTFSTSIFKTWFSLGDIKSAIRLSAVLMIFVFIMLLIEKISRGGRQYSYSTTKVRPLRRIELKGIKAILAAGFSWLVFAISFLIPLLQLGYWSLLSYQKIISSNIINFTINSLAVGLISAFLIIVIALIVANTVRTGENLLAKISGRFAILGYSIPGAVIAVGVLIFFLKIDKLIQLFTAQQGLFLSTSIILLIFAYIIRFLAIAYNSVESGFAKVGKHFFEASRTLGVGITETFFKVDLKMIRPAVISGFLLTLIEIMKELPLTLILRPFNFNTLASKAFEYANDEMIHEAALSSLILVLICMAAIYGLQNFSRKKGR